MAFHADAHDTPGTVTHADSISALHARGDTRLLSHWYSVTDYRANGDATNLAHAIRTKRDALARARRSVLGKEHGTTLAIVRRHERDTATILTVARVSARTHGRGCDTEL